MLEEKVQLGILLLPSNANVRLIAISVESLRETPISSQIQSRVSSVCNSRLTPRALKVKTGLADALTLSSVLAYNGDKVVFFSEDAVLI